jgi:hypothetical protein
MTPLTNGRQVTGATHTGRGATSFGLPCRHDMGRSPASKAHRCRGAPSACLRLQAHEAGTSANETNAIDHCGVGGIRKDHLVARIGQAEEGVEHRIALPAGDHDLAPTVITRAAAPLDLGRHGLLEVVATREKEPTVRFVLALSLRASRRAPAGRRMSVSRFSSRNTSGSSLAAAATRSMLNPGISPSRRTLTPAPTEPQTIVARAMKCQ